jgi:hypothetical protein
LHAEEKISELKLAKRIEEKKKKLSVQLLIIFLCNGWEHYVPSRCLQISNKLCDSTLCTCGGVGWGGGTDA